MRGYPELMFKSPYYDTPEYHYNQYLVKHREKQNKGASYTRDSERLKTYRAEWAFEGQIDNPKFKTIEEAQKWIASQFNLNAENQKTRKL